MGFHPDPSTDHERGHSNPQLKRGMDRKMLRIRFQEPRWGSTAARLGLRDFADFRRGFAGCGKSVSESVA
jgi:hypothetical protein